MKMIKDFIYIAIFLLFLGGYVGLMAWGGGFVANAPFIIELIYYIIGGFLWIIPAKYILRSIGGR